MSIRILQPFQAYLQRIQLPLFGQSFLLLRLAVGVGLIAERVAHHDESEAVVPCSSFAAAEGCLREKGAQEGHFAVVVVLSRREGQRKARMENTRDTY
jgi:hypothetical protein